MTPVVSASNLMPKSGNTKNRKKICTSSGVLRMNSMIAHVTVLTTRMGERRRSANTRPRT